MQVQGLAMAWSGAQEGAEQGHAERPARLPGGVQDAAGHALLATLTLLPEPKGSSLEEFTETRYATSAVALSLAQSRGTRPPAA